MQLKLKKKTTSLRKLATRFIQEEITFRNHVADDHNFLFATYLQNNWYDKTNTTTLKKDTWMSLQHKRLEKVLDTQNIKIACLSDHPDVILGYAFQDGSKPFCYLKLAWRNHRFLDLKEALLKSLEEDNE
jgi:hypothetical protein